MFTLLITFCIYTEHIYTWRYYIDTNTIVICEQSDNHKRTLVHEIWHRFWYQKMSEMEREEFAKKVKETNWIWWELYSYSWWKVDIREDFALLFVDLLYYKNIKQYKELKKWLINLIKKYA